jgi:serine phosphatase RsbU (regulator of sigma subunit)/CheY-like chemotaxis protein
MERERNWRRSQRIVICRWGENMTGSDDRKIILLVDDAPGNIEVAREILKGIYKTRIATSGAKALESAKAAPPPDLILLDVQMPEIDGYEVCRRLKLDPATRGIPVIFLTAMTEVSDETRGFEIGAVDYIHKPFSPPVVLARVQTHLNLREAREQLAREKQLAIRQGREIELVEQFGRGLLSCSSSQLVASTAVNEAVDLFGATAAVFEFVLSRGTHCSGPGGYAWSVPESLREEALERGDWVRHPTSGAIVIPLVLEHTPVAYFGLLGITVSDTVLTAISSQLKMTLGRVLAGERLLQLAGEIQMGLLPKQFSPLPDVAQADVFATIVPTSEVGGDFYQYFLLDSDHLCFVIGDVSDKGIPAALFMAMTLTAFVVAAKNGGRTLPDGIRLLNRYLCDNNPSQMFVTLYAGILDLRTGIVEYCDGGHEPPFLIRNRQKPELTDKQGGVALGIFPECRYRSATLQLDPGDTLFLYTDGVTEARNAEGDFFKIDGIETVLAADGTSSSECICQAVMKGLGQFVGGAPQNDDITMLAVSYRGPRSATCDRGK